MRKSARVRQRSLQTQAVKLMGDAKSVVVPRSSDIMKYVKEFEMSRQIVDPFSDFYSTLEAGPGANNLLPISPKWSPNFLMGLQSENNMLKQCIDAMVTNVECFGHRLEYVGPEGGEESTEAKAEKEAIESFLAYPNDEYDLTTLRERLRRDLEGTGNCYIEVIRDVGGNIISIYHIPAHTMRATRKDKAAVEMTIELPRAGGKLVKRKVSKLYRRYVQWVNERKTYFKEYGDPRPISANDGKIAVGLPFTKQATEIIHLTIGHTDTVYGVPRWINQMPSVLGSREAEQINLEFFRDNAIPAMALIITGGQLMQHSADSLTQYALALRGRESMHRVLVLEVAPDENLGSVDGTAPLPSVKFENMQQRRQGDELFQDYDANNQTKVRSSFRLPPLFVGRPEDHSFASAEASMIIAENQVFGPERRKFDEVMNLKLLSTLRPRFWRFRSQPPKLTSPESIITAINTLDAVGAMTPNVAIGLANELFDLEIEIIKEAWGNYPFAVVRDLAITDKLKGMTEILKAGAGDLNEKEKIKEKNVPEKENGANANSGGTQDDKGSQQAALAFVQGLAKLRKAIKGSDNIDPALKTRVRMRALKQAA